MLNDWKSPIEKAKEKTQQADEKVKSLSDAYKDAQKEIKSVTDEYGKNSEQAQAVTEKNKDIIDRIKLTNEYIPSNKTIWESIAHPHVIPSSAKNKAPHTEKLNILFSTFIILTPLKFQ